MRNQNKTNIEIISLIELLYTESHKKKVAIWRDLAARLERPNRNWPEINISHIKRHANKNDTIVIPGKLLGAGYIDIPVTIAAFQSSQNAREKIIGAGGKVLSILDLVKKNPQGKGVRIFC